MTGSMNGLIMIAILLTLVGVVAGILMALYLRRPKVHMIDTVDLMRLDEALRSHPTGRGGLFGKRLISNEGVSAEVEAVRRKLEGKRGVLDLSGFEMPTHEWTKKSP